MDRGRPGPDRQHPRYTVDAFVRVLGSDAGREFVFRVRDLSQGGLFLYTKVGHLYPFKEGTALTIELFDFDQAVEFRAVIVRIVQSDSSEAERFPLGFGVKIVEIDEGNRNRLELLLERAKKGEPLY
jgi:hypothetical protein